MHIGISFMLSLICIGNTVANLDGDILVIDVSRSQRSVGLKTLIFNYTWSDVNKSSTILKHDVMRQLRNEEYAPSSPDGYLNVTFHPPILTDVYNKHASQVQCSCTPGIALTQSSKYVLYDSCEASMECISGNCQDGVCVLGLFTIGAQCTSDVECMTNMCISGSCTE